MQANLQKLTLSDILTATIGIFSKEEYPIVSTKSMLWYSSTFDNESINDKISLYKIK